VAVPFGTLREGGEVVGIGGRRRRGKLPSSGVHEFFALQFWEIANRFSGFLFCDSHVVEGLQIQPELRAGAEEMTEAKDCIAGDAAGAVEDLGYAIGGHGDLSRQFRRAYIQRLQFLGEVLAGVNRHPAMQWVISRAFRFLHGVLLTG
jgi:hypothetical protein